MRLLALGCLAGLAAALGGCTTPQERAAHKENLLAAAGFEARPADTADRQTMLAQLPANHFVMRSINGQTVYLYADPIACNCVYFGNAAAYGRYKQERFEKKLADEQAATAAFDSSPGWAWGPWGGGWWGP